MYGLSTRDQAVEAQRRWLTTVLAPVLSASKVPVYGIFGNSDMSHNADMVVRAMEAVGVTWLHGERPWVRLPGAEDIFLVGYSGVAPSDHRLKDWERIDRSAALDAGRSALSICLQGLRSSEDGLQKTVISQDPTDTIGAELSRLLAGLPSSVTPSRSVWVMHGPPHGTHADMATGGHHVGSVALRDAIVAHQPLATLHGHIHETVIESGGEFCGRLGAATVVYAVGNGYKRSAASAILLDTRWPDKGERLLLPTQSEDGAAAHEQAP